MANVIVGNPNTTQTLTGTGSDDIFQLEGGNYTIVGNGGVDTVDLHDAPTAVNVDLRGGTITGWGTSTVSGVSQIYGSWNGGTLTANDSTTYVAAPGGDTTITLGASGAIVVLGSGNDTVHGGAGNDFIYAGSGSNTIDGGAGYNAVSYTNSTGSVIVDLYAGAWHGGIYDSLSNVVNIEGSSLDDTLRGDWQDNIIVGGAGNDSIDGREGNDTLTGGAGADTFIFRPNVGRTTVTDFSAAQGDKIDLSSFGTFHSLSDVLAVSSQSGSNTVIQLGAGAVTLQNMSLASLTPAVFSFEPSSVSAVSVPFDFNADGKGDLFWQNAVSGLTSVWTLNDTAASGISLPAAPGWQVQDVGNFTGTSLSGDFLLRNPTTGMVNIWLDKGGGQMAGADAGAATLDWNIMAAADFNGDGKSDILWRNEQNGYVSVWQMDGTQATGSYNPGQVGLNWHIVGAADYTGDGRADILWRNASSGEVNLWQLDSQGQAHGSTIATLSLDWQAAGSGDFNGDGKADILWRNANTGQAVIWEMNGSQVQAWQAIGQPGPQWKIAAVTDMNGDGKSDIIWRDSNTGQVVGWAMNGFNVDHSGVIATVDTSWQLINHHFDWV